MIQKKQNLILLGVIWGLVIVVGIVLLVVVKNKNTDQVLGAVNSPQPTDTPANTTIVIDTPTDSVSQEPSGTPFVFDPTPYPASTPTPVVTQIPTPTPSPTPAQETYQASITSINPSGSLPADGTSYFSITVNVTDQNGNAKGGVTVGLSSDSGLNISPNDSSDTTTDGSGNATFKVSSGVAKTYTLTVLVYHSVVTTSGSNTVIFYAPTPSPSPSP